MNENSVNPTPVEGEVEAAPRTEKVQNFQLQLTMDDDLAAIDETAFVDQERKILSATELSSQEDQSTVPMEEPVVPLQKAKKKGGCLKKILYALIVAVLSVTIAWFAILFLIDMVALNRSDKPVDIEIPAGANTQVIADILHENGIIDYPFCFRVFSKLTRSDGKYQQGSFTLTADMGYTVVVDTLQTMTPRETVTVTIPEGYTIEKIADLLEKNEVCEKKVFFEAVITASYDYDFVQDIPVGNGRIYLLEGYLFPDTYNFYVGSSGETVVKRMLDNFSAKVTPDIRAAIQQKGMTLDEAVIIASIIQGEAASKEDMQGVSRVLFNRLEPGSGFPKLQCDSTGDYVKDILPSVDGVTVTSSAYDTYEKEGLPAGAINNPGMDAIHALLNPSEDEAVKNCYYFATDYDTGITYFSKTYSQHETVCRKYGIGMYG